MQSRSWTRSEALGGRVGPGGPMVLQDVRGGVEDVPQGGLLPPAEGVPNRRPDLVPDRLQLGQGKVDRPLVPLVQLQPVGQVGEKKGDRLALSLGEQHREMWSGGHRLSPLPRQAWGNVAFRSGIPARKIASPWWW
jgi:hypothetical protein